MKNIIETNVLPNLGKIEQWAKKGATSKEIAKKLGIAYSTLRKYIKKGEEGDERYKELAESFARGCAVSDDEVEAALFKRACGITAEETRTERVIDKRTGEVTKESIITTQRYFPPDPTSAMFWLTNRRGDKWAYKPKDNAAEEQEESGVVVLAPVMPNPGHPEGGGGDG